MAAAAGSLLGIPALPALEGPVGEYLRVAEDTLLRVQELRGHLRQLEAAASPDAPRRASAPAGSVAGVSAGKRKRGGRSPTSSTDAPPVPPTDASSSGLRRFSRLVCDRVAAAGPDGASYAAVADELVVAAREGAVEGSVDEKNVRRRVYDALNVLEACGALRKVGKDVAWIGWPSPDVLRLRGTDVEAAGRAGARGAAVEAVPLRRGRSATAAAGGVAVAGGATDAGGTAEAGTVMSQGVGASLGGATEGLAVGVKVMPAVVGGLSEAHENDAAAAPRPLQLVPKAEAAPVDVLGVSPDVKLEAIAATETDEPASPPGPGGSSSPPGQTTTPPKEEGLRKMSSPPGSVRPVAEADAGGVVERGSHFSGLSGAVDAASGRSNGALAPRAPTTPTIGDAKAAVDVAEGEALRLVRLVRLAVRNRLREVQCGALQPEQCLALPFALVVAPPGSHVDLRRAQGGRLAEVTVEPDSFALLDDDRVLQVLEAVRGSPFALPSPETPVDPHSLIADLLFDGWSGPALGRPPTAPASPVTARVLSTPGSARSSPIMPRAATLSAWVTSSPSARTPSPAGASPARRGRPHTPTSEGPSTPQDRLLGETPPPLFTPLSLGSPLFDLAYSSPTLLGRTSAMATPAEQLLSSMTPAWSPSIPPLRAPSAGLADRQGIAGSRGVAVDGMYGMRPGTADQAALDGDGDLPLFGGLDGDEPVGWAINWNPRRVPPRPASDGRGGDGRASLNERLAASAAAVAHSYEDLDRLWGDSEWAIPKAAFTHGPRAQGGSDDPGGKPSGA